MVKVLYNRCTGICKFGNNTYPRRIRRGSNLGHIFSGKKVRLAGREIRYMFVGSHKFTHFLKINSKVALVDRS